MTSGSRGLAIVLPADQIKKWRPKQRVLCQFDAHYRIGNSTRTIRDSAIITVEFSSQILDTLMRVVKAWRDAPMDITLLSYLPEGGEKTF